MKRLIAIILSLILCLAVMLPAYATDTGPADPVRIRLADENTGVELRLTLAESPETELQLYVGGGVVALTDASGRLLSDIDGIEYIDATLFLPAPSSGGAVWVSIFDGEDHAGMAGVTCWQLAGFDDIPDLLVFAGVDAVWVAPAGWVPDVYALQHQGEAGEMQAEAEATGEVEQKTVTDANPNTGGAGALEFFAAAWPWIVAGLIAAALITMWALVYKKQVAEILFYLVTQAEKQYGGGTGELKYAAVTAWLYERLPGVAKMLFTAAMIDHLIEAAVTRMKKYLADNINAMMVVNKNE